MDSGLHVCQWAARFAWKSRREVPSATCGGNLLGPRVRELRPFVKQDGIRDGGRMRKVKDMLRESISRTAL